MPTTFETRPPTVKTQLDAAKPGSLKSGGEDSLLVHTRNAYWLFHGQRGDRKKVTPIVAGATAAGALRKLWLLTATDNPYADWILTAHDETFEEMREAMKAGEEEALSRLQALRDQGMSFELVASRTPATISIRVQSPYGYSIALQTASFDRFVRAVKTLTEKHLLSQDEGHAEILAVARPIRNSYLTAVNSQKILMSEALIGLCRADFTQEANEVGKRRAELAKSLMGEVPAEILAGSKRPAYSRRLARLGSERQLVLSDGADTNGPDIVLHSDQAVALA